MSLPGGGLSLVWSRLGMWAVLNLVVPTQNVLLLERVTAYFNAEGHSFNLASSAKEAGEVKKLSV